MFLYYTEQGFSPSGLSRGQGSGSPIRMKVRVWRPEQPVRIVEMDFPKKKVAAVGLTLVALLVTGCASATSSTSITPAPDKPTFLYFYTEG